MAPLIEKQSTAMREPISPDSKGPGLDMYAHNLGEDNSTVIG